MILVVEQPAYLPWLGYFDLMQQCDEWVWYDDVQYTQRDWRNRNRIAAGGEPIWLTVPVVGGPRERTIAEVLIDGSRPWAQKQLETLRHCYGSAPGYPLVADLLRSHFERSHGRLADLVIGLGESLAGLLGIAPRFRRSSQMNGIEGRKQDRLLAICKATGATVYLSGPAAKGYIDPVGFAAAGLELRYIVYGYPEYPRGGQPWVPSLSIVDALAWIGVDGTRELLAGGGRYESVGGPDGSA